jgi:hypothetical protein
MYSMYIMILIAAACLPDCLPVCLLTRPIIAFSYASSLAHFKCSFIFIRSQARYRAPTHSVDLIITELLVYRSASALFFIVVLVSSPTLFSCWPFALRLGSCSAVLCLSLSDLVLVQQFFAIRSRTCFLVLRPTYVQFLAFRSWT